MTSSICAQKVWSFYIVATSSWAVRCLLCFYGPVYNNESCPLFVVDEQKHEAAGPLPLFRERFSVVVFSFFARKQ